MDVAQMAQELCITEKEALHHLEHVVRSMGKGATLQVNPASCIQCGYVFRGRSRLSTPTKCPRCRSHRIIAPTFQIRGRR
jgi:hypothetical protein